MELLKNKHEIKHSLHQYYDEIKSYTKKKKFIKSAFYATHQHEINEVIDGLEWDNTLSVALQKNQLRIVSWNIERGRQLDRIIAFFKENPELAKADVILAIECDNGMGRTDNRNVSKELAEALNMNYCFAPSYLVLGKGALGETNHSTQNTLALHGTSILSKYPIVWAKGVVVPPVKEVFHSSEKRLGCKKGLVVQIQVGDKSIALGAIHIDLSSTANDRAEQLKAVLTAIPEADIQLIGGDWNCGTFNLRRKWEIITQSVGKLITIGFTKAIHHYMTPELKYDKPLFDVLLENGFVFDSFNDHTKGTIHLNIDDVLTNSKAKRFIPTIFLKELSRRLRPWNGAMPLKIDWLAGKGGLAVNAQTIVNPQISTTLLSDHNPIYVDLELT